jgi:hypothetical protein
MTTRQKDGHHLPLIIVGLTGFENGYATNLKYFERQNTNQAPHNRRVCSKRCYLPQLYSLPFLRKQQRAR